MSYFDIIEIDDMVMDLNLEFPYQLNVVAFYVNRKYKDKEWHFVINLN